MKVGAGRVVQGRRASVFEEHRPGAGCRLGSWWDGRRDSVFEGRRPGAGCRLGAWWDVVMGNAPAHLGVRGPGGSSRVWVWDRAEDAVCRPDEGADGAQH